MTTRIATGVETLIWRKLGAAQLWLQGDYGREQANAALPTPTQDAQWWAIGGWVTYNMSTSVGLGLRGDYVNDENGAPHQRVDALSGERRPEIGQRHGDVECAYLAECHRAPRDQVRSVHIGSVQRKGGAGYLRVGGDVPLLGAAKPRPVWPRCISLLS